jgi:hypothetical protein
MIKKVFVSVWGNALGFALVALGRSINGSSSISSRTAGWSRLWTT